jgi:hypothetical protein
MRVQNKYPVTVTVPVTAAARHCCPAAEWAQLEYGEDVAKINTP